MDLFYALGFAFFVFIIVGMLVFQRYFSNSVVVPENEEAISETAPHVSISVCESSVVDKLPIATLVHVVPVKSACFVGANQNHVQASVTLATQGWKVNSR